MIRAFIGIDLPPLQRKALGVEQFLLPIPRREPVENLHLTLVFLGEVAEPVLAEFDALVRGEPFAAPDISIRGLGLFGGEKPRLVYAAVEPEIRLTKMQHRLAKIAKDVGCAIDDRKFTPHITLGRLPRLGIEEVMRLERAVVSRSDLTLPRFQPPELVLWQSHLGKSGASYLPLAHYPLTLDQGAV